MAIKVPPRASCARILDELIAGCDGVDAAMLSLRDGQPFVEKTGARITAGKFAAMSSSLVALGSTVLRELNGGALDHILVEGSQGKLVLTRVAASQGVLLLSVFANNQARLGQVLGHAKNSARIVGEMMQA